MYASVTSGSYNRAASRRLVTSSVNAVGEHCPPRLRLPQPVRDDPLAQRPVARAEAVLLEQLLTCQRRRGDHVAGTAAPPPRCQARWAASLVTLNLPPHLPLAQT